MKKTNTEKTQCTTKKLTKKQREAKALKLFSLANFLRSVNKLGGHSMAVTSDEFGTVSLYAKASESSTGKRQYKVTKAPIKGGKYNIAKLRNAYLATI